MCGVIRHHLLAALRLLGKGVAAHPRCIPRAWSEPLDQYQRSMPAFTMDFGNQIALVALLLSGFALALEVRRWVESGVHLNMSILADAVGIPEDDGQPKLAVTVTNRGTTPTTITHFMAFAYRSVIHRVLKRSYFQGWIPSSNLPSEVDVNGLWHGIMYYDADLSDARTKGHLYIGIASSHSNRTYLKRVPPRAAKVPKTEIGKK